MLKRSIVSSRPGLLGLLLLISLTGAPRLYAQAAAGLTGSVTDASGAAIADATV